jgi:DNA-binding NarL/FixJ family response regulator
LRRVEPTPRQLDILRCLALRGGSNRACAYTLRYSEATIKADLRALYRDLDVDTPLQAVAALRLHGIDVLAAFAPAKSSRTVHSIGA